MKIISLLIFLTVRPAMANSILPIEAFYLVNQEKAIIIDVRESEELKSGMVKEAISLPLSILNTEVFEEIILSLPPDKILILYCRSGRRANIVLEELQKRGFEVRNMGGFDAWVKEGLPIENFQE